MINYEKLKKITVSRYTLLFMLLVILAVTVSVYISSLYNKAQNATDKVKKIYDLTQKQAKNINYLQNQLNLSKQATQDLEKQIAVAQSGRKDTPQAHITIQAPSLPAATKIVSEKIIEHNPTMPPEALRKSDRTIVTEQPNNKKYQVGVYKINLKHNWYVGVGVGYQDGRLYIPISLQRNYDMAHAIAVQTNVDITGTVKGGQVLWKVGF